MNHKVMSLCAALLLATVGMAQKKSDVLLTIANEPVGVSEFKRVYLKNLDLVQDESQKSVEGYLDLFIDYRLKLAEAYAQNLHKTDEYKREFAKYQEQLSRNYIFEDKVTEELTQEAYQRGLEEIRASHILVQVGYDAVPQDTLEAYNKIRSIRDKALSGADFDELVKQYSEEPGAQERGSDLGYFSVFSMVYPFESMAYQTEVGEVSEIVRTQFGYHILKVLGRRERSPELTVSHIMISDNKEARTFDPQERINEVYALLQQGKKFEDLAQQYSEDKNSAKRGGRLNRFSRGDLRSKAFEEAAYALKAPGEISQPFQSEFGWHIVRLEERHAVPTYEEQRANLEKRVKQGDRSKIVTNAINAKIKEKYGFEKGEAYTDFFDGYVEDELLNRRWSYDTIPATKDKVLFSIGDKKVRFNDFAQYIEERQRRILASNRKNALIDAMYAEFETKALKDYFQEQLEVENEQYAAVISEYRNGLLIFDVMERNVWNEAKNDSLGLERFYEQHKENYKWKKRIEGTIVNVNDQAIANQVHSALAQGESVQAVKERFNANEKAQVLLAEGVYELGSRQLPEGLPLAPGVSKVYESNGVYTIVVADKILPPSVKELDTVRGKVMSDYQNHLELQWLRSLRKKYPVVVNKKALKKVKKEFQS